MAYQSNRRAHDARIERAVIGGIDAVTAKAAKAAKPLTPVRSGRLRDSMRNEPARTRGDQVVGSFGSYDVPYAIYVEKGTRRMAGRFMLQRAADATFPDVVKEIRSRLR